MRKCIKNEDFIYEIAHDIKAPIISIDFALKNTERDGFMDEIYNINKHNLNYIENMLSAYSFNKGEYIKKTEIINIIKIVKEEISVLNFLICEKGLRVLISTDKLDEPYITSDKYLVRQIVLNLLTNAVKYAPKESTISIVFEKKEDNLSICFKNLNAKQESLIPSNKMGLNIVKKKLKAIKGKLKITKNGDEICFNVLFKCV